MPSNHKGHPTIAFRPGSKWQYALIEERAALSGLYKKDFISRSCIYSNICVVGTKDNIQKIVDAVQEMQMTMKDIACRIEAGDFSMSDNSYQEMKNEFLALSVTVVEILDGAAYLFGKEATGEFQHWKQELEMEQLKSCLSLDEN